MGNITSSDLSKANDHTFKKKILFIKPKRSLMVKDMGVFDLALEEISSLFSHCGKQFALVNTIF